MENNHLHKRHGNLYSSFSQAKQNIICNDSLQIVDSPLKIHTWEFPF
jgi:hypothetical protein